MRKLFGSKADRDELTKALQDTNGKRYSGEGDARYQASQKRIREAEAKLPRLGRAIARDRSL